MSISSSTLSAIQKLGAATFLVSEKLNKDAHGYEGLVAKSIAENAYSSNNEVLFDNWKATARLAQTLGRIEAELKSAYELASKLNAAENEILALAAPASKAGQGASGAIDLKPVDVKIKAPKKPPQKLKVKVATPAPVAPAAAEKASAKKSQPRKPVVVRKAGAVGAAASPKELQGNPLKLIQHMESLLNADDFIAINQTEISKATSIPMGSMSAALNKLVEVGRLVAGNSGQFKLAATPA